MHGFLRLASRPPAQRAVAAPPAVPLASTLKVLLVDDCEVNRMLACAQLMRFGIEPTLACNGAQALEQVQLQRFDLVLMDVSMPVMDGLAATAQIRRLERAHPERARLPVVAHTAGGLADDPTALRHHGFDALLRKPSNTRLVGACLQQVCGVSLG